MRKIYRTILLSTVLLVAALILPAKAGLYHRDAGLVCSDCHVAHGTEGNDLTPKLLKASDPELCLSCHDGQTGGTDPAPDVLQASGVGQAIYRAAGASKPCRDRQRDRDTISPSRSLRRGTVLR